jgi:hypothetical protein
MRLLLLLSLLLATFSCRSNKISSDQQNQFEELRAWITTNNPLWFQVRSKESQFHEFKFEQIVVTPKSDPDLYNLPNGTVTSPQKSERSFSAYYIITEHNEPMLRAKYIYLNDSTITGKLLADSIIHKYNRGVAFEELAAKYTQDGNSTGELGWFAYSRMVDDFSKAVITHRKGDIYKAKTRRYGWYVIHNTHNTIYPPIKEVVKIHFK